MISQLTSSPFDQLLLPPPSSATTTTVVQPNDCGSDGCAPTVGHCAADQQQQQNAINGRDKQCRKRKRRSASKDNADSNTISNNNNNNNNNNDGIGIALSASSSTASAEGDGASPKLAGVEQQLVASSPSLFLQQALRHNNILDGTPVGGGQAEDEQQQGTGMATMDFFEAHKAFQKLSNQLGGFTTDSAPSPAMAQPGMSPFVQQLATLSPFLLALQHQSQQFVQAQQHQFDPAALLSIPPIHNASENLFHHIASSPMGYAKDEEEEEEEEEEEREGEKRSHSGTNPAGEPEDLSLKHDGRSDAHHNSSGNSHNRNGTPNWSYEEQFKQLYELSPSDLNRKEWLDDWLEYMRRIGKPVTRIPIMAKQVLDLYELYRLVVHHGGLVEVITKKLWREIAKGLSLPTSITSAAFTLRTQYEKYLFDFECHQHKFSTLEELRAAIEANKREGRRNGPPGTGGGGGAASNSAGATPAGAQPQHNHHYSGGRHSSTNSANPQSEQRHVQQQHMRWLEQMAASFGTAAPPPPMVAAAFFGKQLLQFGTAADAGMPTMARATTEEESVQQNGTSRGPSSSQSVPQFAAGTVPFQLGTQNGEDQRPQFDSIFPKIEFVANGRSSTSSPQAFGAQRQNAGTSGAEARRCHRHQQQSNNAASSPATSACHCATSEHPQQQQCPAAEAPTAEKRRKPSDSAPAPASACRAASPPNLSKNGSAVEGTSAALPLGPFGHLLKNASRCNIKVNGAGETKSANGTFPIGTLPRATTNCLDNDSSSMVMSMEINGVLYQGVLFAMPTVERETEEVTERQNGCKI